MKQLTSLEVRTICSEHPMLNLRHYGVFDYLASFHRSGRKCWASHWHMSEVLSIGIKTVARHIKAIEKAGFLKIERTQSTNKYTIIGDFHSAKKTVPLDQSDRQYKKSKEVNKIKLKDDVKTLDSTPITQKQMAAAFTTNNELVDALITKYKIKDPETELDKFINRWDSCSEYYKKPIQVWALKLDGWFERAQYMQISKTKRMVYKHQTKKRYSFMELANGDYLKDIQDKPNRSQELCQQFDALRPPSPTSLLTY